MEQVDFGSPITSSAPRLPEATQRRSRPPSSPRVSDHIIPQPSTQTRADEINLSATPSPHREADSPIGLQVVDISRLAEQVDLGNPIISSASGPPEETQRHSCPPSSSRFSNHIDSQPSTQTTADEINLSVTPFSPHPEVDPELASQIRGAKNGIKGLKGRDTSLPVFNKKKGTLDLRRHIDSQPSTQTTGEINLSATPSGPHPEAQPPIELAVPQIRGGKSGIKGLKGRDASLLTFNKKKGTLEILKRSRAVKDSKGVGDTEEVLQLLESPSATFGSMMFPSGSSIAASLQNSDGTAAAAEQAIHGDTEFRSLADYEAQNRNCPHSPNIE